MLFRRTTCIWLVWLTATPLAWGAPTAQMLIEWLDKKVEEAAQPPALTDLAITFSSHHEWTTPRSRVDQLRTQIRDLPDHPEQSAIRRADKILKGEIRPSTMTLRYRGPSEWRISVDRPLGPWAFRDTVVTPKVAWSLTPDHLDVIDPREGWPPGKDLTGDSWSFRNALDPFLHGGLSVVRSLKLQPTDIRVNGDTWSRTYANGDDIAYRFEGRWRQDVGDFEIDRRVCVANKGAPQEIGLATEYSDWQPEPLLARRVSRIAASHWPDGSLFSEFRWVSCVREEPGTFEVMTAVPRVDGSDPIRGPLTVSTVFEHRRDSKKTDRVDSTRTRSTIESSSPVAQPTPSGIRMWGWIAAGGVAAGLVGVRIMRGRVSTAHS